MVAILETMMRSYVVEEFLEDQNAIFFHEYHWTNCINIKGDYIEK